MAIVSVDVDIDDLLRDLDSHDKQQLKQQLVNELYDEGFVAEALGPIQERDVATTYLEQELSNILDTIFNNRLFLTNDDIQNLKQLSSKGAY
jgi:hypothetical protein